VSTYPTDRQGRGFAIRFLKWLVESGATTEIGPEAVSVLVVVVTLEDRWHYQRAVNLYNEQLEIRAGFRNTKTMDVARDKAVKAGLLHYEPSVKRTPGVYWVLENDPQMPSINYQEFGRDTGENQDGSGAPPYQVIPTTPRSTKRLSSQADGQSPDLHDWIEWWNGLHANGLVSSKASTAPSKAVTKAWSTVQKSFELQELLADRSAIETAIQQSNFVRGGWFRLEKLLGGKNRAGEFIVRMLVDGGYASTAENRTANTGPGVNFDPMRRCNSEPKF